MMNIRKIIREEIERVFKEQDASGDSLFGGTLSDVQDELQSDLDNVGTIIKTQQTDINNMDNQIKADLQLKSKLDNNNPHRKGLEIEIPQKQKEFANRKKQVKDLEDAQKGLEDAQSEIKKQQDAMDQQSNQGEQTPPSVLPSLQSPI